MLTFKRITFVQVFVIFDFLLAFYKLGISISIHASTSNSKRSIEKQCEKKKVDYTKINIAVDKNWKTPNHLFYVKVSTLEKFKSKLPFLLTAKKPLSQI